MKSIKITITPEQRIHLAHAATLEIDLPDYNQVCAERDNAWSELRDIRKAINANPEESTFDECQRIANQLNSAKTQLEAITALLNPNGYTGLSLAELLQQRLAEAACGVINFCCNDLMSASEVIRKRANDLMVDSGEKIKSFEMPDWARGLHDDHLLNSHEVLDIFGYSKSTCPMTMVNRGKIPKPDKSIIKGTKKTNLMWSVGYIKSFKKAP